MGKHFDNHDWNNAYVTADLLSSFTEFAKAVTAAFSSKVTGIKPTEPRFDTFNGINYGGTNYINVTGHEIYHGLERQRPDLHAWLSEQARECSIADAEKQHIQINNKIYWCNI